VVQNTSKSSEVVQHLSQVQDENGTDLELLRRHLQLSVEARLLLLEEQLRFATSLREAGSRATESKA
jgi:hypothetical protein